MPDHRLIPRIAMPASIALRGPRGEDRREDPGVTYSNYLYIRYGNTFGDGRLADGSVPQNEDYCFSPDITVSPCDSNGNPVAETEVSIEALVFNDGFADAIGAEVEFWWFDPTMAFTAANGHRLWDGRSTTLVSIPQQNYTQVSCPVKWVPQFVNDGHECLVVVCRCPGEGTNGLDENLKFSALLERHVGQRNLTVSPAGTRLTLRLDAPNPFAVRTSFTIRLTSVLVAVSAKSLLGLGPQTIASLVNQAAMGRRPTAPDGRELSFHTTDVTANDFDVHLRSMQKTPLKFEGKLAAMDRDRFLVARGRTAPDRTALHSGWQIAEVSLEPSEKATFEFAGPPVSMGAGQFLVHRFNQVVEDAIVGSYAAIIAPIDFSKREASAQTARESKF